jgi:hypothetical protein
MNGAVQIQASMSLDGFIAGPGDDMDWIFEHVGAGDGAADVMEATGAILAGAGPTTWAGVPAAPRRASPTVAAGRARNSC